MRCCRAMEEKELILLLGAIKTTDQRVFSACHYRQTLNPLDTETFYDDGWK